MSKFTPATALESDMYYTLRDIIDICDGYDHAAPCDCHTCETIRLAKQALAKADGK